MSTTAKPPAQTSGRLDPLDFLEIDALLGEEERLIRDTVRDLVRARVLTGIEGWFEEGIFPKEMARELGELGLLGMHLQGYGCAGASAVSYGLACLELEAGDSGFRSFVSVQGSLAMFPIRQYGSEEQKQQWLPPMARGEAIGCFGLTEPDFGSDPAGMRTSSMPMELTRRPGTGKRRATSVSSSAGSSLPCSSRSFARRPAFFCKRYCAAASRTSPAFASGKSRSGATQRPGFASGAPVVVRP